MPRGDYTHLKMFGRGRNLAFGLSENTHFCVNKFFGNFFKMSYIEYQKGIQHIMDDESKLEDSIMRDLYFLGKSLGNKYQRLRICYTVFMGGIIFTVLVFGISYLISQ